LEDLVLENVVIFYGQLVYFVAIWYVFDNLLNFSVFSPDLVCRTKKTLVTLNLPFILHGLTASFPEQTFGWAQRRPRHPTTTPLLLMRHMLMFQMQLLVQDTGPGVNVMNLKIFSPKSGQKLRFESTFM
jgi:hypothetical protein